MPAPPDAVPAAAEAPPAEPDTHTASERPFAQADIPADADRLAAETDPTDAAERPSADADANTAAERSAADADASTAAERPFAEVDATAAAERPAAEVEANAAAGRSSADADATVAADERPSADVDPDGAAYRSHVAAVADSVPGGTGATVVNYLSVAAAAEGGEADPPVEVRAFSAADRPSVASNPNSADASPTADAGADGSASRPATEASADGTTEDEAPDPALFAHALRIAEALVFASDRPVTPARLQSALPPPCDARSVLGALAEARADSPVRLVEVAGGFSFRTAPDLAPAITRVVEVPRRLPRAAMETLAIVAYHQPVTRAEIEEIRGASLSQSTLESLLDAALIAPRGHKEVPGRPSLWGTTPRFLEQFGLKALADLPRREELVNEPTLPLSAPVPPAPRRPEPEKAAPAPQPAEA